MTMGIVVVACLAERVGCGPAVTMTSTLRRTSSPASEGRRSDFPSANRHSMKMFFPSIYPSSRSPCRNASMPLVWAVGVAPNRSPIVGIFFACCASAAEQSAKSKAQKSEREDFVSPESSNRKSKIVSLDYLIRPIQHRLRNRETEDLRRLQVNDQLKLHRLLHWKVGGSRSFDYFVNEVS